MLERFRWSTSWLGALALALVASTAFGQVPADTTFTGTLVDDLGAPLAGPVDLELRIFDVETMGTQLYSEQHTGTALDASGRFSVQLGLGASPSGTFDASLFSDVDRWLEVVVGADVLTPRLVIAAVPWALVARQANEIVPDPNAPRFEDCGDGTVADHQTGLQWEQKTGTVGVPVSCGTAGCPDPHHVNNQYEWSDTGTEPDGNAFTDFLTRLNGEFDPEAATGCLAGHCDWALPKISELQTIMVGPEAAPGQATTCAVSGSPPACIDPDFAAVGGPSWPDVYWSTSTTAGDPLSVYIGFVNPSSGTVEEVTKTSSFWGRAVRTGSCH